MKRALVLLVLLAAPRPAHALGPLDVLVGEDAAREARLDTGADYAVVGWLAYGQRLPPLLLERPLAWEARVGMPLVQPDLGDLGAEGSLQIDAWGFGRWRLRDQLDLGVHTTSNAVFDGVEVLARDTVSFGWQGARAGFGVDLGWEQGLSTHIHHSDWYRNEVYPGAEDGWLAFPAGKLRLGLYGGGALGARFYLAGRLGLELDRTGRNDYLPLVGVLTAAYRF